jgi:Transposase DDE domain
MPFKHNAARRHHIGKMKFKVTNWAEYEAGLRRRGSLTLWMTAEALSSWQAPKRTTRGGQPRYSDLAIETALTMGLVFGLRLRQTEGLLTSVLQLMGLDLAVPDHTTLSRRARTGDRLTGGKAAAFQQKNRSTSSLTAPASKSMAPASGWRKSTARGRGGDGGNCIQQ